MLRLPIEDGLLVNSKSGDESRTTSRRAVRLVGEPTAASG